MAVCAFTATSSATIRAWLASRWRNVINSRTTKPALARNNATNAVTRRIAVSLRLIEMSRNFCKTFIPVRSHFHLPPAARVTIDANANSRHFYFFKAGGNLNNVTLQNGKTDGEGGAIVLAGGALTLNNVVLTGNVSETEGGAIHASNGSLSVTNSTLSGNTAFSGGGIYAFDASVTVTGSTVANNTAFRADLGDGPGGGVAFRGSGTSAKRASSTTMLKRWSRAMRKALRHTVRRLLTNLMRASGARSANSVSTSRGA